MFLFQLSYSLNTGYLFCFLPTQLSLAVVSLLVISVAIRVSKKSHITTMITSADINFRNVFINKPKDQPFSSGRRKGKYCYVKNMFGSDAA